jgi:hypothetical protein
VDVAQVTYLSLCVSGSTRVSIVVAMSGQVNGGSAMLVGNDTVAGVPNDWASG